MRKRFNETTHHPNIRKARKEGSRSTWHSRVAVAAFYRLHCETRRHHGLPPQPWSFFDKIQEHIIAKGNGFCRFGCVSGTDCFRSQFFQSSMAQQFSNTALPTGHFSTCGPTTCCYGKPSSGAAESGFRSFHLGRTEPENGGSCNSRTVGVRPKPGLRHYKYDLRKGRFLSNDSGPKSSYRVFKMMPAPSLRLTGNLLYKHVG